MQEKDVLEKRFMQRPDIFAEVFNLFVFNGRDVIKPEGLQDFSPVHLRDDGRWRELRRDLFKVFRDPVNGDMCFLGLENQESHDGEMAVRIMGMDWNCYQEQLAKHCKEDLHPVGTLVLNWGEHRWTKSHDIIEKIDKDEKKRFSELITPYLTRIVNMMFLDKETIMKMKTELKQLCMALISRSDKAELDRLMKDPEYSYLSVEAADLIALKLNLKLPLKEKERKEGKINMCRAWEEIKQDEFNRGVKKGAAMQKEKYEPEIAAMKAEKEAMTAEYESREKRLLEENRQLRMRLKMLGSR